MLSALTSPANRHSGPEPQHERDLVARDAHVLQAPARELDRREIDRRSPDAARMLEPNVERRAFVIDRDRAPPFADRISVSAYHRERRLEIRIAAVAPVFESGLDRDMRLDAVALVAAQEIAMRAVRLDDVDPSAKKRSRRGGGGTRDPGCASSSCWGP
jgi:hypothetical protein